MSAVIAALLIASTADQFPIGSYKPDISGVPKDAKGIMGAYFNLHYLVISPGFNFTLAGGEQRGYWRQEGKKYVLVFDGFFAAPSSEPEEVLRKKVPKNHLEGLVLEKGPNGTLILNKWGQDWGPVIYRPLPRRSITELVKLSSTYNEAFGTEKMGAVDEAHCALIDRVNSDWFELLMFINDPKQSWDHRIWAAINLGSLQNSKGIEEAVRMIPVIKDPEGKKREASLRRILSRLAAKRPTDQTAERLIKYQIQGLLRAADVAPALGRLKREKHTNLLIGWLSSEKEFDKIYSLQALTELAAIGALPQARQLVNDPQVSVQLAAHALIARTTPDELERKASVRSIAKWTKGGDFMTPSYAVDALVNSRAPEAFPHLVALLSSDASSILRSNVADDLGDLGDLRAVPALLEARQRRAADMDGWPGEARVIRSASEALVKLGRIKRGQAGRS